MFDGFFRPDNAKRQARAIELGNDCMSLLLALSDSKGEIERALGDAAQPGDPAFQGDLAPGWTVRTDAQLYHDLAGTLGRDVLDAFALVHLGDMVRKGSVSFRDLDRTLGLPDWFKWDADPDQFGLPGQSLLKEGPLPALVNDETVCSATRDAIHALVPARRRLKRHALAMGHVVPRLSALAETFAQRRRPGRQGPHPAMTALQSRLAALEEEAGRLLAAMDQARGSWTSEDS